MSRAWMITLVRLYLMIGTASALVAVPAFGILAWYASSRTAGAGVETWLAWAAFLLVGAVIISGPFVGWWLFKRGRIGWTLATGALAFLFGPLLLLGLLER